MRAVSIRQPNANANKETPRPFGTFPRGFSVDRFAWPLVSAGELVELNYGKSLVDSKRSHGSVPVYGTNGPCGWHSESLVKGPGVILGRKGMGHLGVEWCDRDFWVIDTAYYVTSKTRDLDLKFFYYLTKYVGLNHLKDGTSNPSLSRDTFYAQLFPHPPLPAQRAIASVLGALDDKVELNRRMNETLEALARALFQNWFVDANQAGLPKGWREGNVSDLATLSRDGLNPGEFPDEIFDHYSIPAFDEGQTPKPETGDAIKSNKFVVTPGCVLVSKLNPRIPRVWLPDLRGANRAICSTEFLVTSPTSGVSREFLFCLFTNESVVSVFTTMVTGTSGSHQRVKSESLLRMDTVIPPQSTIQSFTKATAPLLERISHNIAESRTLAALRDALLPKLLLGELRVPVAVQLKEACA